MRDRIEGVAGILLMVVAILMVGFLLTHHPASARVVDLLPIANTTDSSVVHAAPTVFPGGVVKPQPTEYVVPCPGGAPLNHTATGQRYCGPSVPTAPSYPITTSH